MDTAAYWMVKEPSRFDVILTTNLYGDILSDMAAAWGGGLGLAPALNLGDEVAIAEPVHGSAPDIAGQGIANPTAAILSGAMLARHKWGLADVADRIEAAVHLALGGGDPDGGCVWRGWREHGGFRGRHLRGIVEPPRSPRRVEERNQAGLLQRLSPNQRS